MNRTVAFVLGLALVGLGLTSSLSAQVIAGTDFDGNRRSDLLLITFPSSSLIWNAYSNEGNLLPAYTITAGELGNHLAVANWTSTRTADRAFINLASDHAVWNLITSTGVIVSRNFGGPKDSLVSGGDFNGNMFADAAYVKKPAEGDTQYEWSIRSDFFKDIAGGKKQSKTKKVQFGSVGDTIFFANVDGKNDWLGVIGANDSGPGSVIRFKNPVGGKTRSFTVADFTDTGTRPLRIRQSKGKPDILGLANQDENTGTSIKFVNMKGRSLGSATLPGDGTLVVGDFLSARGNEVAIQVDGGFLVHNPLTAAESSVSLSSGVPVDDININSFDSDPEQPGCDDETLNPHDGTDKFLWKPVGIHSGALRVLFPQIWTGKIVEVVLLHPDTQAIIESANLSYDASNPNARTFAIFSKPGARYPDGLTVRAKLGAGCYKSYVIPETSVRTD